MARPEAYTNGGPLYDYVTLGVARYVDTQGRPVCCSDVPDGHYCRFYGNRGFGQIPVCMITGETLKTWERNGAWPIPADACPVWPPSADAWDNAHTQTTEAE